MGGYYHGRPPSQTTPTPAPVPIRLEAGNAGSSGDAGAGIVKRTQLDDFQQKWDKFGRDDFIGGLESGCGIQECAQGQSTDIAPALQQAPVKATAAARSSMLHGCDRNPMDLVSLVLSEASEWLPGSCFAPPGDKK